MELTGVHFIVSINHRFFVMEKIIEIIMSSKNIKILLLFIAAAISLFGLVTGRYLFIFLVLPLGWLFKKR